MNRTQRAKIRAQHEGVDMYREFKNDALATRFTFPSVSGYGSTERFKSENEHFKAKQKQLRRMKKFNGPTGMMTEEQYQEVMGY